MPSKHLILCRPLLLLPSVFPSIRGFSNESALCIRWPKYWSFSFSISPSNEYSGLISFRIDWFDLLAVQGTLKSYVFFMSHLSHLYMTTGKTIALTVWTFVSKVMSLLCSTLSRFVVKHQKFSISQSAGQTSKAKVSAEPLLRFQGTVLPASSSSQWLQASSACGCITPASASIFTGPCSLGFSASLLLA